LEITGANAMLFHPQVVGEGGKYLVKMDYVIHAFPCWKAFQIME